MVVHVQSSKRKVSSNLKITQIRKRDGRIVAFDKEKITSAVYKAVVATGGREDRALAESLSTRVIETVNPLINYNKTEVLKLAIALKVPLRLTWSCYEDSEIPCGKCRGCISRQAAFNELGIRDPLLSSGKPGSVIRKVCLGLIPNNKSLFHPDAWLEN